MKVLHISSVMGKKITYEKETVDKETGESLKTYSEAIVPREPDYVKLYLESITKLNDVQGWTDPVLYELLKLMNYRNERCRFLNDRPAQKDHRSDKENQHQSIRDGRMKRRMSQAEPTRSISGCARLYSIRPAPPP